MVIPNGGRRQPQYGPPQGYPVAPQWGPPAPPVPPWGVAPAAPIPPRNSAKMWAVIAAAVAVVATATAVTIGVTAGRSDDDTATTKAGGTTTINAPIPTAAPTTEASDTETTEEEDPEPAPADPSEVLLSATQMEKLIGGSLESVGSRPSLFDTGTTLDQPQCASVWAPAAEESFADTDYDDAMFEIVKDNDDERRIIVQAAVSYSSAGDAKAYVSDTEQVWQGCSGQTMVATTKENKKFQWQAGDVDTVGGIVTITQIDPGTDDEVCERALGASGTMVVDTMVCGPGAKGQAADIAKAMAKNAKA